MRAFLIFSILFFSNSEFILAQKGQIKLNNKKLQSLIIENNGQCEGNCCNVDGGNKMGVRFSIITIKKAVFFTEKDSLFISGRVTGPEGDGIDEIKIYRVLRNGNNFCYYNASVGIWNKEGYFKIGISKLTKDDYLLFYGEDYIHHIYFVGKLKE